MNTSWIKWYHLKEEQSEKDRDQYLGRPRGSSSKDSCMCVKKEFLNLVLLFHRLWQAIVGNRFLFFSFDQFSLVLVDITTYI